MVMGIVFKLQGSLQILEILVSIKVANPMEENKSYLVPPVAQLGIGDRACASRVVPSQGTTSTSSRRKRG